MSKRLITIEEVLDAMEANNIPLKRGGWFDGNRETKIGAACILGQTAINLGITESSLTQLLDLAVKHSYNTIIRWNDSDRLEYEVMVRRARELLKGKESVSYEADTVFYISALKAPAV